MKPYYEKGGVTIYHGDCLESAPWPDADVMVTDPPYGMDYCSGWSKKTVANDGNVLVRDAALKQWGERPAIVFGRWTVERPEKARGLLVWDKGDWPGMGDLAFPWGISHEEIYVLGEGFTGTRRGTVLKYAERPSPNSPHPTIKPLALMRHLVSRCPAGVVLDPFMGAGTTMRACADEGRECVGYEIEEKYCEIAAIRLEQGVLFSPSPLTGNPDGQGHLLESGEGDVFP